MLDNLGCRGTETRLVDCDHNGLNIHDCIHPHDIGVRCLQSPTRECMCAVVSQIFVFVRRIDLVDFIHRAL